MSESIPFEDSALQQTICNFDVSNIPGILKVTELDSIEGIEESLGHTAVRIQVFRVVRQVAP